MTQHLSFLPSLANLVGRARISGHGWSNKEASRGLLSLVRYDDTKQDLWKKDSRVMMQYPSGLVVAWGCFFCWGPWSRCGFRLVGRFVFVPLFSLLFYYVIGNLFSVCLVLVMPLCTDQFVSFEFVPEISCAQSSYPYGLIFMIRMH